MYILHTLSVYYRPDKYFIIKLQNANGRLKNYFNLMLLRFAVYRWLLALASLLFLFSISPHLFTIFGHGNQIIYIIAGQGQRQRTSKREQSDWERERARQEADAEGEAEAEASRWQPILHVAFCQLHLQFNEA